MTALLTADWSSPLVWNAGWKDGLERHVRGEASEENTYDFSTFVGVDNPIGMQRGVWYVGERSPSCIGAPAH